MFSVLLTRLTAWPACCTAFSSSSCRRGVRIALPLISTTSMLASLAMASTAPNTMW